MRAKGLFLLLVLVAAACGRGGDNFVPVAGTRRPNAIAAQGYAAAVLAANPARYYPLEESSGPTAFDHSTTPVNGTYVGAVTFGVAGPLVHEPSTAIELPGGTASAGVQLPPPPASTSGSYTLQTWVYPLASSNYMTIWGDTGARRLLLSTHGLLLSQFSGNYFSKTALSFNQWHDVVFVYDASAQTASYYIDGVLDSSVTLSRSASVFTSSYYLGQYSTAPYYKWHGRLAQHAFFPKALSAAQIAQIHAAAETPPSPAPTATPTAGPVTVPHFQSAFSYGGTTYTYKMVGSNPATSPTSTTIGVNIVPVNLTFSSGISLNGTNSAAKIGNTALFQNGSYASGTTQYGDAFMRGEFWKYAANTNYHVLLGSPAIESTAQILVPAADGYTSTTSSGTEGYVTYAWFVQTIEPQIIEQLKIDPRTLTIFATVSTKVLEPGGGCCYAGYHSAHQITTASGASIATTAWASVDGGGVETLSHEIGEWLDDPFYTNTVPSWINPISKGCNGNLLEVGDPVTNYVLAVNGTELQDLVYYSWFSRDAPSIGINRQYDLMGKLVTPASSC